jgi:hypothetical protein
MRDVFENGETMQKVSKKIIKSIFIIPIYIALAIEGFLGGFGVGKTKDIWDEVVKWIKK